MTALDAATEAYIARIVADAPPLTPEQAALVARAFAAKTTDATASDAAA